MNCNTAIEKGGTHPVAPTPTPSVEYTPLVDIVETPEMYQLRADIPGARAEDVAIEYERGVLTLHARVSPRQGDATRYLVREFGVGDFRRTFRIGEGIDATRIEAQIADGVLRLQLPKSATARTHRINVKAG